MSTRENEIWLESAYENFNSAIEQEDEGMARAVISDIRDRGFDREAKTLEEELKNRLLSDD